MNIIFYRYGNICEPDIISSFSSLGINVIEEKEEIHNKKRQPSECAREVHKLIVEHSPIFVFSVNFFPVIAELCHIHGILYLCWSVDCPVIELYTKPMQYSTNRIFLFDKEQYNSLYPFNPNCIFHLPLAANLERFNRTISTISETDKNTYSHDISFVGSLYSEHNPLKKLPALSPYSQGYIDGIVESTLQIYGYNFMEDTIPDILLNEMKELIPEKFTYSNLITNIDKIILAHRYLGIQAAETERIRTLNKLAEHFHVDLYTGSDTSPLLQVHTHGTIESLYGMPKVFHLSKINLNMTIKPIKSGLPLRIFDIMGCGGFLMTNYQAELPDYFEIGKDLEAYSSLDELIDKCSYYLQHEDERQKIAFQGYETIQKYHTYPQRITELIRIATSHI